MASPAAKRWEEVQKKAFLHWINTQLAKRDEHIDDLLDGFSSGVELITLVEVLSGKKVQTKWTKKPTLAVHKINNCFIALQFLQTECHIQHITISAEDFVNSLHINLVLGFCWLLLRSFQEPPAPSGRQSSGLEENLLQWVKSRLTRYPELDFSEGFRSESFLNGKAFLALVNEYHPGAVDLKTYPGGVTDRQPNCEAAVKLAQTVVGIPDIIDPEELSSGKLDDKNLVLYLSLFYNAFKDKEEGDTKETLQKRLQELEEKFRVLTSENETLRNARKALEISATDLKLKFDVTSEEKIKATSTKSEITLSLAKMKESYESQTTTLNSKISELSDEITMLKSSSDSSVTNLQNEKDTATKERDQVREELKKTKEKLTKEKEELQETHDQLEKSVARNKKLREELEAQKKEHQQSSEKCINILRTQIIQHVKDMNVWRPLLEVDRQFTEDTKIISDDIKNLSLEQQLAELDKLVLEDNKKLEKLVRERESEAAEVVSVNIGKKKKRIKKEGEIAYEVQKEDQSKKTEKEKEKKKVEKEEESDEGEEGEGEEKDGKKSDRHEKSENKKKDAKKKVKK